MDSKTKEELTFYYKNAKIINELLLNKSDGVNFESINIHEALFFHMSSLMISLLINFFNGHENTTSNYLCARSLLEDESVLLYFQQEINSDEDRSRFIKLFQCTHFIYEYRMYSKYPEIMKKACNVSEMERNYETALNIFSTELGIQKDLIESHYFDKPIPPFFGGTNYSFSKLVHKAFRGEQDKTYKALSLLSHPHTSGARYVFDSNFLYETIKVFGKCFFSMNEAPSGVDFFTEKFIAVDTNYFLSALKKASKEQKNVINDVIDFFAKESENNFVSDNLRTALDFIEEFEINRYLGFYELAKIKMRLVFETFAAFSFIYLDTNIHGEHRYDILFEEYSRYLIFASLEEDETSKKQINAAIDKAFAHYVKTINPSISKEAFTKTFKSSLGWSIDETGKTVSLTALVNKYIDGIFPFKKDARINYHDLSKIYYEESEIMTHGNGYLFSSNSGAFMEIDNCIFLLDIMTENLLNIISTCFRIWAGEDDRNKRVADFLYEKKKKYGSILKKKYVAQENLPSRIAKPKGF